VCSLDNRKGDFANISREMSGLFTSHQAPKSVKHPSSNDNLSLSAHGAKLPREISRFQALAGFRDYVMASVADHDFSGGTK
jgi:hypothetical protein